MDNLVSLLPPKARRGSKARCHLLTHGPRDLVAAKLTALIKPWGVVRAADHWMPRGFEDQDEAQLGKAVGLLGQEHCETIQSWWLAAPTATSQTPNWDIASTCMIGGKKGILLIEAKAHDQELLREGAGKSLKSAASRNSQLNHDRIGKRISEANAGLAKETGLQWRLSRDQSYQMSNRFASSWKLTTMSFPVILVYLGFVRAEEMRDRGKPFKNTSEWDRVVRAQSGALFPDEVWNREWRIGGETLVPLIRSYELGIDHATG